MSVSIEQALQSLSLGFPKKDLGKASLSHTAFLELKSDSWNHGLLVLEMTHESGPHLWQMWKLWSKLLLYSTVATQADRGRG